MLQKLLSLLKKNKNKAEILGRIDRTDIKNWKEANDTANKSVGKKKPKPSMLINIISQLEDNRTREGFFASDKYVLRKKEALWIFKELVYKTLKKEKEKTIENYRI
jgi:cell division protein YceG involved in septum cleavage